MVQRRNNCIRRCYQFCWCSPSRSSRRGRYTYNARGRPFLWSLEEVREILSRHDASNILLAPNWPKKTKHFEPEEHHLSPNTPNFPPMRLPRKDRSWVLATMRPRLSYARQRHPAAVHVGFANQRPGGKPQRDWRPTSFVIIVAKTGANTRTSMCAVYVRSQ